MILEDYNIRLYQCNRCRKQSNLKPVLGKDIHGYRRSYLCESCFEWIALSDGIPDFTEIELEERVQEFLKAEERRLKVIRESELTRVEWNFVVMNEHHCPRTELYLLAGAETEYLDKPDMLHVLVRMGMFESKGQARKNWKQSTEIPLGYCDGLIGKNPIRYLSTYRAVPGYVDLGLPDDIPVLTTLEDRMKYYDPEYLPNYKDKRVWYEMQAGWKQIKAE